MRLFEHFYGQICVLLVSIETCEISCLPNSLREVAASVQSGALMTIAPRITAALNAWVQKNENLIIVTGSTVYNARTRERMVHELAYTESMERE